MRQSTIIGFMLVFLTLLLVLGAAVFFLTGRNQDQSHELADLAATQAALAATTTRDILVREAAADNILKTQEALAGLATQQALQLVASAELAATTGSQVDQSQYPEVVITQPQDGSSVAAGQPLLVVLAAQAGKGVAEIRLAINGLALAPIPGNGQQVFPAAVSWTPPAEESYVIQAVAVDNEGQESEPVVVLVTAAFQSQAARDQARQLEVAGVLLATRFPETVVTVEPLSLTGQPDPALHQFLAAGSAGSDAEAAAREGLVLQAFELVPAAEDYLNYVNNVLSQPILGYYDPDLETTTIFSVIEPVAPFSIWLAQHQTAHVHQIDRFQVDQVDQADMTADQRTALRALAEGEANWLQYLALSGGSFNDSEKVEIRTALATATSDVLNELPAFLEQDFTFAYRYGLPFVQAVYGEGDPAALNSAWSRRPESSEQILHPENYLAQDAPLAVTLLPLDDILDADWQPIDDGTLGEWRLSQHLNLQLSQAQAEEAAAGWGGDRYLLYWHTTDDVPLLVLRLAWDTASDWAQFNRLYPTYLSSRSGGSSGVDQGNGGRCWLDGDVVCLYTLPGNDSLVVKGPNLSLANQIFEQLNSAS